MNVHTDSVRNHTYDLHFFKFQFYDEIVKIF